MFKRLQHKKLAQQVTLFFILAFLFIFLIWPTFVMISKAFYSDQGFTLEYFKLLFQSESHMLGLMNSLKIAFLTTFFSTLISLPLAIFNVRYEFFGKKIITGLLLVPIIMPPFVGAIGIQKFFARYGAINLYLLENHWIKTPIEWLHYDHMLFSVVLLEVLHLYPIMYLNLSATLSNLDPSLEEMASTLGVPSWKRYKDIIWPLVRPGFFSGSFIVFIWALTDLGTPLLVGFRETMPVQIFNMITDIHSNPVGFALVFFIIVLTVTLFIISKKSVASKNYEMIARGHSTSAIKNASLVMTVGIYLCIGSVIFLALIPHTTVIITSISHRWFMTPLPEQWTLEHYTMIIKQQLPFVGVKNSLVLSLASTLVDAVLGLTIAYLVTRSLKKHGKWLDGVSMIPLALPGIVLAFGYVVTFSGTFLDPLHNPAPLLIIAYSVRRLPYMVRAATAGLQQTSKSLEEASETFGASKLQTMRKITIPLVTANLIAGGLLCFSYAMLDVSDSMILAMKDQYYPMTKAIYSLYLEQGSGEFIASALGVVSMLILTLCILGASLILGKKMGELFKSS